METPESEALTIYRGRFSTESKTESSQIKYYILRTIPPLWWVLVTWMWFVAIHEWAPAMSEDGLFWVFPAASALAAAWVVFLSYMIYRYLAYVRITPDGLAVRKGKRNGIQPWLTIAEIRRIPWGREGLWKLTFTDGAPPVLFLVAGYSEDALGRVPRSQSIFVAELRTQIAAAKQMQPGA